MMRSKILIALTIPLIFFRVTVSACPACEKQLPKLLKGISHGIGPDGNSDYFIIACAIIIVLFTLFYSLKWLLHPGEKSDNHIKQIILNAD